MKLLSPEYVKPWTRYMGIYIGGLEFICMYYRFRTLCEFCGCYSASSWLVANSTLWMHLNVDQLNWNGLYMLIEILLYHNTSLSEDYIHLHILEMLEKSILNNQCRCRHFVNVILQSRDNALQGLTGVLPHKLDGHNLFMPFTHSHMHACMCVCARMRTRTHTQLIYARS